MPLEAQPTSFSLLPHRAPSRATALFPPGQARTAERPLSSGPAPHQLWPLREPHELSQAGHGQPPSEPETRATTACNCSSTGCASQKLCRHTEFSAHAGRAELHLQARIRVDAVCKGPATSWVIMFLCFLPADQRKPLAQQTAATCISVLG